MTSKYQKVLFYKEKLLKIKIVEVMGKSEIIFPIAYSQLKLSMINNQLCFVTDDDYFMPICRWDTLKDILDKYFVKD
jgi:hypothetical protein